MPFDESGGRPGRRPSRNVLGGPIGVCSNKPMTGFFRNGCCETSPEDIGSHTVCAVMTAEFLAFSKRQGNDLSTSRPEFGFVGLKPGDRWCLCAPRWQEALEAGSRAPGGDARDRGRCAAALSARGSDAVRCRSGVKAGGFRSGWWCGAVVVPDQPEPPVRLDRDSFIERGQAEADAEAWHFDHCVRGPERGAVPGPSGIPEPEAGVDPG